jgi:ketosteroid isomerase-like protein
MPIAQVQIVKRIYEEGLLDRSPEQVLAMGTEDIEYVNPPEAVDPGTRRGAAEVGLALGNIVQAFDHSRHELREIYDDGDSVVVALVSFHTRSGGSDVEIEQTEAHTWTFRGDRIARFEWGRDLRTALRAAGIER